MNNKEVYHVNKDFLKKQRKNLGLSQRVLAETVSMKSEKISHLERGPVKSKRKVSINEQELLALVCGLQCTPRDLIIEDDWSLLEERYGKDFLDSIAAVSLSYYATLDSLITKLQNARQNRQTSVLTFEQFEGLNQYFKLDNVNRSKVIEYMRTLNDYCDIKAKIKTLEHENKTLKRELRELKCEPSTNNKASR